MSERANLNHRYFLRFLAIGAICLAMAGWFLYDAKIGYPKRFEYLEAYESNPEFHAAESKAEWYKFAESKGWPQQIPSSREEIESEISGQYVFMGISLVIALPFFLKYFLALGSYIEATPEELRPSWRKPIALASIEKIDKTKWSEKGITKIYYDGQRKFVFDDFKFEREPMGVILGWIEDKLDDDKIVGGKRESAKGEDKDNGESAALADPTAD